MQYARHNEDQRVWEAAQFAGLPAIQVEQMRQNLSCVECDQFAWFRKESRHGHPPHFCAHHLDSCSLRVEYVVSGERDGQDQEADQLTSGDSIVVRLDLETGNSVAVHSVQANPKQESGSGGTRYVSSGAQRETYQHFTLRRILYRLVQSPAFRSSSSSILLFRNENEVLIQGQVNQVAVPFSHISRGHHDRLMLYWGPISSAGRTDDGKVWLNSSIGNQSASVAVFEDVADEFLHLFRITDLEELAGAHVLVAGRCLFASTGKPVIWCGSPKYIVVRKYKDAG